MMPIATVPAADPRPMPRVNRPSLAMLARDADAMYWMSRYVERAEHVARLLMVNSNLLIDVGDLDPALQARQWETLLTILHVPAMPSSGAADDAPAAARVCRYMTFATDNPNSLIGLIARARDNARGIREQISAEMFECLNGLYWYLRSDDATARFDESSDAFYRHVINAGMMFQGLTDQTLAHDQRWLFAQLGKYLERIDVTARVIETKFALLRSGESSLEAPVRTIHWMAVLRSCCGIEHYRRVFLGDMDPLKVAAFLILERNFPRSIRFAVEKAHEAISCIHERVARSSIDPAQRILGRLSAELEYAEMAEVMIDGLPAYLHKVQTAAIDTALAVQKAYFLH